METFGLIVLGILVLSVALSIIVTNKTFKSIKSQTMWQPYIVDNIPDTYIAPSEIHGMGLFAGRDFAKGEVLTKLDGMMLKEEEFYRIRDSLEFLPDNVKNYIFMEWTAVEQERLLVRPFRTKYSFINHSRTPNLKINFDTLEVVTLTDIKKDTELTLDYREEKLSDDYIRQHGCSYL
ncbi:MAG: SET domain-containing protein [Candidatus Micrarchaeota archaeon]|nr:SET domain-containing protein [Candidatus Micrarchaeota archaeon]